MTLDVEERAGVPVPIKHQFEVDFDANVGDSGAPIFINNKGFGVHTDSEEGDVAGQTAWFSHVYYLKVALQVYNQTIHFCIVSDCI